MENANQIHFNLDGVVEEFSPALIRQKMADGHLNRAVKRNVTNWELFKAISAF
jgi:hypothetical protein